MRRRRLATEGGPLRSARPARRFTLGRGAAALVVLGASFTVASATVVSVAPGLAGADSTIAFANEQFSETTFPPAGWTTPQGTWTQSCPAVAPATGCSALATDTSAGVDQPYLFFTPSQAIPANLANATLSYYSDFTTNDPTSGDDALSVLQADSPGATEDLTSLTTAAGGPPAGDVSGTPVLHTVPLANANVPIEFRWTSYANGAASSPLKTWGISDVEITGTAVTSPYTLTAVPIPDTVTNFGQAFPKAGSPVPLTLSGSSTPSGDGLSFAIVTQPKLGSLGAITTKSATSATVVYNSPPSACTDPTGIAFPYECDDTFTYEAVDDQGTVSPPAEVVLDLKPPGAGGQTVVVSAPGSIGYSTVNNGTNNVQAADLSSDISVGPANFPDEVQVDVSVPAGSGSLKLDLANAANAGAAVVANGDSTHFEITGSVEAVNASLVVLDYFPPSGTTPTTTLTVTSEDLGPFGQGGGAGGGSATVNIAGPVVYARPVLRLPTGALAIANNAGLLTFPSGASTGLSVADASATATTNDALDLTVSAGRLALPAADTSGAAPLVVASSLEGGAILDLSGTVANLNAALADLTFDPTNLPSESVALSATLVDPDDAQSAMPAAVAIAVTAAPLPFGATSATTLANDPAVIYLCAAGPSGDTLEFIDLTTPTHGTAVVDTTASAGSGCTQTATAEAILYTPATNYTGADSFSYRVTDLTSGLQSAVTSISISVVPHDPPTAYAESATTTQGAPVTILLCGTNPEQQSTPALTFSITTLPDSGTLVDAGRPAVNGCSQGNVAEDYTYTPVSSDFTTTGMDVFSYDVSNGAVSAPVDVTITVTTLTPQVTSESVSVNEDGSVSFALCTTTPNDPTAPVYTVSNPSHGVLDTGLATQNGPPCPQGTFGLKTVRYTPTVLYSGPDSFTFSVSQSPYGSALATISLTVAPVDIAPTVPNQSVVDHAPHSVAITLSGDSMQGLPLTFSIGTSPSLGTLTGTAPDLIYTPSVGSGTDSFTYTASDGTDTSVPGTVTITIATPQLSTTVCQQGAAINAALGQYACGAALPSVSDGHGGQIALANTSGSRNAALNLQGVVTNDSAVPDTVTLTASAGVAPWGLVYDIGGAPATAALTGVGDVVTLGPVGSATASVDIEVIVFAPGAFPAPATTTFTLTAVSGNGPTVSSTEPVEVADGSSAPQLALANPNGSGSVSFPGTFNVVPVLYNGGPSADVLINLGITGTGDNTFAISASGTAGSTPGVTPTFLLGGRDVTSAVLAGTEVIECYAGIGCPPLTMVLTPGAGVPGPFGAIITATSTVDGQSTEAMLTSTLAGSIGPDLSSVLPNVGVGVFETTPSSQIVPKLVQVNSTGSQLLDLVNQGDVTDTYHVTAAETQTSSDPSTVRITASAPSSLGAPGAFSDVTSALEAGTYSVTLTAGQFIQLSISDSAGSLPRPTPATVVVTATSTLESTKVDSFEVTFSTYSYQPDAILTGPNGQSIGAGVFNANTSILQLPNPQVGQYAVDQAPQAIRVSFAEAGLGTPAALDAVVIRAPATDINYSVSYSLNYLGQVSDVTAALEGSGLDLNLGINGTPGPVITMTVAAVPLAQIGHQATYPITVTSQNSTPAGVADAVLVDIYNDGTSFLQFAGLPQTEPADITRAVSGDTRVPPIAPPDPYVEGVSLGAYAKNDGSKFVYDSAYDTYTVKVTGATASPEAYRVQVVDALGSGVPAWETDAFSQEYYTPSGGLAIPLDPLGSHSSANVNVMAGSQFVTSAIRAGTYTTPVLASGQTFPLTFSANPTPSVRYAPLRVNLLNTATGQVEDSLIIDLSSIIICSDAGIGQQSASINTANGPAQLNFESFNRAPTAGAPTECMQQLSHSWITQLPVVFSSPDQFDPSGVPGGLNPQGLWLEPQLGSIIRINTDTLEVTANNAKGFVDSPELDNNGKLIPTTDNSISHYYYLGDYSSLDWRTTDQTNGLQVAADSTMPSSPFPLEVPLAKDFPGTTMGASRYFEVSGASGIPEMVGEMEVDTSWYVGDIPLNMPVDNTNGLVLDYKAPTGLTITPPSSDNKPTGAHFFLVYWATNNNGVITQGGCLGLPMQVFALIGIDESLCPISVTVSYNPVPDHPGILATINSVAFFLTLPAGKIGVPTFNVASLSGSMDFAPPSASSGNQDVTSVTLNIDFGVGPPTPCQEEQDNRAKGTVTTKTQDVLDLACPQNYFFFDAQLTIKDGGYTQASANSGVGIQLVGTLSFINLINLASVTVDVSTSPFDLSFVAAPSTLVLDLGGVGLQANLSLSGDINATGFSISVAGSLAVNGQTLASASGVVSTKGFGVCAGLAGTNVGIGDLWGSTPTFYASGCTTTQYAIT